jgi:hypothetical protein
VGLPIVIGVAAAISGWWFVRNWRLYGDPTGLNVFVEVQGRRTGAPVLRDWIDEFGTFRWTYWGLFGAVDVMAPLWVYRVYDALSLLGLVGFVLWIVRRRQLRGLWLSLRDPQLDAAKSLWWIPALWSAFLFVSVLRWTWIFYSFQGRLMFPNIGGISALLMLGLCQWVPKRLRPAASMGIGLSLLVIAAMLPFTSILPAYAQPEPLALSDVPERARVDPVDVGSVARVVGWELEEQIVPAEAAAQGEASVDLVVYWQAVSPDGGDYVSFARLLGRDYELAGEINRRPACGMVPTDLWKPGQVWRDPYRIPVAEHAHAPSRLRVEVGLYSPKAGETLGAIQVGEAKLPPPCEGPDVEHPLTVELSDGVTLLGYNLAPEEVTAGERITLTLHWEVRQPPSADYQVFVHLLGEGPEPLAQGDGPPLRGDYPTSMWAAGETIADPRPIQLPDGLPKGHYRLAVGLYDLQTLRRLTRLDGKGDTVEIPESVVVR